MDNKTNKMLIDATHPEETRVVVLRNGRVEEFDYESAARKLLRGNIYLAKVTRVEPSLQAAFVEYGGNRHGFLAFNEIHPDYSQIPMADRQALIDEEAAAEAEADAEADARAERRFQGDGRPESSREGGREGGGRDGRGRGREGGRDRNRNGGRHGNRGSSRDTNGNGHSEAGSEGPTETVATSHDQNQSAEPQSDEHAAHHQADNDRSRDQVGPEHNHDHDHDHHDHARQADEPKYDQPHDPHAETPDNALAASEPPARDTSMPETTGFSSEAVSEAMPTHDHAGDRQAADSERRVDSDHSHTARREQISEPINPGHIEEVSEVNEAPETIGADSETSVEDDGGDFVQDRPRRQRRRQYKIQEVIKRRQVILIQIVKEERGNKGAALTTYLSLAGRYTVLMPNTGRGGGISRKITNPADRKRLKAIAQELDVPEGMGLIIRTAGAARTSQEIKRDYEYLLRLWESVRDMTLQSTAPSLVYEEGNLIKRSIRDLYTKEIDEIVVAGNQAYEDAASFMRMLMPSHAKNVIKYTQPEALFSRYPIERQLNAMFSPYVTLRSGGYLVINQTEALVSIDVNSGKSTREYSIEETALNTNLEASDEIARQLKLRDLAGLIVIDFIDMEENRNNRAVERRLKDALRFDRARIQVGRISHFGLLEMSRQRMRTGVLEGSTSQCPHCQGTGTIRSVESVALAVLRGLEEHLIKDPRSSVNVLTTATVALYILNNKRSFITEIEARTGVTVAVQASDRMQGANFAIERSTAPVVAPQRPHATAVSMDWGFEGEDDDMESSSAAVPEDSPSHGQSDDGDTGDETEEGQQARGNGGQTGDQEGNGRSGRRRRRRRGRDRGDRTQPPTNGGNGSDQPAMSEHNPADGVQHDRNHGYDNAEPHAFAADDHGADGEGGSQSDDVEDIGGPEAAGSTERASGDEGERGARRGRRRGRRGGRRGGRENRDGQPGEVTAEGDDLLAANSTDAEPESADATGAGDQPDVTGHPSNDRIIEPARATTPEQAPAAPEQHAEHGSDTALAQREQHVPEPNLDFVATETPPAAIPVTASPASTPVTVLPDTPDDPARPRRRGWWQRRGLGE